MKIALANWTRRQTGGIEEFIARLLTRLATTGEHELLLLHESDDPPHLPLIPVPAGTTTLSIQAMGKARALEALYAFRPDAVYAHALHDPDLHGALATYRGAVVSMHGYNATCVSGQKIHMRPVPRPCSRALGPGCLVHYFPHRCGGIDPRTLVRGYRHAQSLLAALRAYGAVAVHSEHMRRELARHGIDAHVIPLAIEGARAAAAAPPADPLVLLYLGRFTHIKGGLLFLHAARALAGRLRRHVECVLAGDGPERARWEAEARNLQGHGLTVRFVGWVEGEQREKVIHGAHLLVMPSLWPEPFGMVGLEAGAHGVPAVAFEAGGVTDWLRDGANGALARGPVPEEAALADAILRCVDDPAHYMRLREGARAAYEAHAERDTVGSLLRAIEASARK